MCVPLYLLNLIGITFLAIKPASRCAEFANKLCWPHNSIEETQDTYNYIISVLDKRVVINGFIGFSNGGFFLNQLVQTRKLNVPVISIGAAGCWWTDHLYDNLIYLLVGKYDLWHYDHVKNLYMRAKSSGVKIELIEYDTGHFIDENTLIMTLNSLSR